MSGIFCQLYFVWEYFVWEYCVWSSIMTIEINELACNFSQPAFGAPSLSNINIDVVTVRQILAYLRKSAAGPGGITGIFYKRLAYWLASPLATVYQQEIVQARIPDDWRLAKVIPLFKGKGD